MRKILPLLVVSVLVLAGLGAVASSEDESQAKETVFFSKPLINEQEEFVTIDFQESTAKSMEAGKPMMPKYTKVYTFPFGTKINNVDVSFSEETTYEVSKLVEPAPERLPVSTLYMPVVQEKVISYSDIDVYPETRHSYKAGAGLDNGKHVIFLTVSAYPMQYNPSENLVYYSDSVEIDVTYTLPKNPATFGDAYDYLIIAPASFESALQPLADYKNSKGVDTTIVTLEEIPDTGVDKQESIKYYIKDAIENWGITYLLLVGAGVEDAEVFPVRYAYIPSGSYEDSFPSDLYYADIYNAEGGFSSWDADKDGKYAEVTGSSRDTSDMDMYPDVYMGKIPANTPAEASDVVAKIINYYKHNKMLNTIVQIGGDTFPGDPEEVNEGEFANNEVMNHLPGYSTTQLWASTNKLTKNNIAKAYKDGVDFADYSGHGSQLSWATHPPEDDSVWIPDKTINSPYTGWLYVDYDLFAVNNDYKLQVLTFNACSTSKYSKTDMCLSYKVIAKPNGGGIASFGASGIGYGSYGTHEIERVWGWMEVKLHTEYYNAKVLGICWANALNGYINSFYEDGDWDDGDYKTVTEVALFGDPSQAIQDGEDPKTKPVNQPLVNLLERILELFPRLERIFNILFKI